MTETTAQFPLDKLFQAAEEGHAEAQFRLGVMYANGDQVELNYDTAVQWFNKSARQGHENALITLAWIYANGAGVTANEDRARELYLLAAEHGSAKAQYVVATLYRFAQYGVKKDLSKALDYYTRSANQGFPTAQFALGKMLMEGRQVEKDNMVALQWLALAHANGSKRAEEYIKEVLKRLPPEQLEQAKTTILGQTR